MKDTLSYLKSVVDHPGVVSQHDGRWEWAIPLGRYAEGVDADFWRFMWVVHTCA